VTVKSVGQCEDECDENHWYYQCREHSVRNQDGKVQRTRPSSASEVHRPHMKVIVEVTAEKNGGGHEGSDHGCAMPGHDAALDEVVSDGEQDCGGAVQRGIEWREDAVVDLQSVQAAGWVVLRFTITNAAQKIATVNIARIRREVPSENWFIAAVAGKRAVRSTSSP